MIKNIIKINGQSLVIFIILICFIVFGLIIIFGSTSITCANVDKSGMVRGVKVYSYTYHVNNKRYRSSMHQNLITNHSNIKNDECVKVKYNKLFPFSAVIIDKRFVD